MSIKLAQDECGASKDFIRNSHLKIEAARAANEISESEYNKYLALYDELRTKKEAKRKKVKNLLEKKLAKYDVLSVEPEDKAVDDESSFSDYVHELPARPQDTKTWPERDADNLITVYKYQIPVPGKQYKLRGELSRSQMETIYALYPYATLAQVSREFPLIPIEDLRRITRAFGITKDTKFPPHVLEEKSELEVAEFGVRAKVNNVTRKMDVYKSEILEKANRDLQIELRKHKQTTEWAERIVQKYLQRTTDKQLQKVEFEVNILFSSRNVPTHGYNTYSFFSDIHFGKFFPSSKHSYGRGTDKDILRNRCQRIAQETIVEAITNGSKEVHLICNGDLFESIIPDGMHPGHASRMDMTGDEQVMFAIDVFDEMLGMIFAALGTDVAIKLHGIGGNHDRIQAKREEDKGRTATLLFYKMLQKIVTIRYSQIGGKIDVINYVDDDGIIRFAVNEERLSFIGHHGDAMLAKRTPTELTNMFKTGDARNYTVIFQGHYHSQKVLSEGINYVHLQLGSVCSGDEYSQNNLGVGAQPSFLLGRRALGDAYGFDFKKVTLH